MVRRDYKYIIKANKETDKDQTILYIGKRDDDEHIIECLVMQYYYREDTANCPVIDCFDKMMSPLRLNVDFKIVPMHSGEKDGETVYITPLCHDDFKVLLNCKDKDFLFNFIEYVIYPEKPTREQILHEINKLDQELLNNKRKVLETEVKINNLQRRFNLEGYN